MKTSIFLISLMLSASVHAQVLELVDPHIGTGAVENSLSGNNYPGATVPFGMVQLSPDTKEAPDWDCASGYNYNDTNIYGFSHTHLSGTGASDLIDILLFPTTTDKRNSAFSHQEESACPGYYSVRLLDENIRAELTATARTGVHRYTYPAGKGQKVFVDLDHSAAKGSWGRKIIKAQMHITDPYTLEGYRIITGWAPLRKVCFSIRFSHPIVESDIISDGRHYRNGAGMVNGTDMKGYFSFRTKDKPLEAYVGISAVSIQNARENRQVETNEKNFDEIKMTAETLWNSVLSKISADFADADNSKIFYTALYHTLLQPNIFSDVNGDYIKADYTVGNCGKNSTVYTTFSIWDTYRGAHALYDLIAPDTSSDMVNSMLDHAEAYGYLPIWELWGQDNYCMIGNHAVSIIVEAIQKGVEGIDPKRAWNAIRNTLTISHPNSPWDLWERYGYMPETLQSQSVSITLEDSYDYWCAARLAERLGLVAEQAHFDRLSQNYRNLYNPATGLFQPKDEHGQWLEGFDALKYGANGGSAYTEGNAWQWLWSVQHDPYGLMSLAGGKETFISKLDYFFTCEETSGEKNDNASGFIGLYAHGNEPSHHVAFLYTLAGQPWKTDQLVDYIKTRFYNTSHSGYAGNDDCGEMSAWYVFAALGLYPLNPASGDYILCSPSVDKAAVCIGSHLLRIDVKRKSEKDIFVKNVRWNGRKLSNPTISHKELAHGGTLTFDMTSKPAGQLLPLQ